MTASNRNAYTVVELIFVIMVLGILAVTVIPKMMVNRDDAKAVIVAQELGMCISDAGTHYMKDGVFDNGVAGPACHAVIHTNACFTIVPDNNTGVLNVKDRGTSTLCQNAHTEVLKSGLSSATGVDHEF